MSNVRRHMRAAVAITLAALQVTLSGCSEKPLSNPQPIEAFLFTYADADEGLRKWLKGGGNPNEKNNDGASLLFVATGPKGGNRVLEVLLRAGADPNVGQGSSTPLMNAASWVNAKGVKLLLAAGADPLLKDETGRTARQQIGRAGGRERSVVDLLEEAEQRAAK
jgi:hypothetical protein